MPEPSQDWGRRLKIQQFFSDSGVFGAEEWIPDQVRDDEEQGKGKRKKSPLSHKAAAARGGIAATASLQQPAVHEGGSDLPALFGSKAGDDALAEDGAWHAVVEDVRLGGVVIKKCRRQIRHLRVRKPKHSERIAKSRARIRNKTERCRGLGGSAVASLRPLPHRGQSRPATGWLGWTLFARRDRQRG